MENPVPDLPKEIAQFAPDSRRDVAPIGFPRCGGYPL